MDHITMKQALNISGKTSTTLRRWIAEGLVKAQKNQSGKWSIDENSLKVYLARYGENMSMNSSSIRRRETRLSPDMSDTNPLLTSLQDSLQRERDALNREQKINDELRMKLGEKDKELLKLTYEMQAILKKEDGGLLSRWLRT